MRILAMFFSVFLLFSIPVSAFARASDYICDYTINVYKSGKKINIDFDVSADRKMSKIGASEIKIYEEPYTSQNIVFNKKESDSGMSASGKLNYSNSFTYSAASGKMYKVVVTIFARDATGSDSRTETTYLSF